MKLCSNADAADTENGKDHQCKNRKQNFSDINAVPFYRIEIAPLGKIWKQITTNKSQSGGVQWNDSKVRKAEKPCAQKATGRSKRCIGKGKFAACYGKPIDHIAVIEGNNDHNKSTDYHCNGGSQWASIGEEGIGGHDKCTPTNDAAQCQRPYIQRRKLSLQPFPTASIVVHCEPSLFFSNSAITKFNAFSSSEKSHSR